MLFSIQKKSFFKLYRYYLKKLRWGLLNLGLNFLLFLVTFWAFGKDFNYEAFETLKTTFGTIGLLGLGSNFSFLGLILILWYAAYKLRVGKGTTALYSSNASRSHPSEEGHVVLFACPLTRQTILAAKLAAFATYYLGINLVGITLPTLVAFAVQTQLSGMTLLSFFLLHGFLLSFINFLWIVPAWFMSFNSSSFKWSLLIILYLTAMGASNWLVFKFVPLLAPLIFIIAVIAGIFFTYSYWKIFSSQDLEC